MSESWRTQLRDAEGQWIEMGSKVKWLVRGAIRVGTVKGQTDKGQVKVQDEKTGRQSAVDPRQITVIPATNLTPRAGEKRVPLGVSTSASIDYSTYLRVPKDDPIVAEVRKYHGITAPIPQDATEVLIRPGWQSEKPGQVIGTVMRAPRKSGKPMDYVTGYHRGLSVRQSHERLAGYRQRMPLLEAATARDAMDRDDALVARLLLRAGIRVDVAGGKDLSIAGRGATYGASSLQARHVQLLPDGVVRLRFTGKKQRINTRDLRDPALHAAIANRLQGVTDPNTPLFPDATYTGLTSYVRESLGSEAQIHDLRRNFATQAALVLKAKFPVPKTKKEYADQVADIGQAVAVYLNEDPKQPLISYIDPFVFSDWRESAGVGLLSVHEMEHPEITPYPVRRDMKAMLMVTDPKDLRTVTKAGPGEYQTLFGHRIYEDPKSKRWIVETPGSKRRASYGNLREAKAFVARQKIDAKVPTPDFAEHWGVVDVVADQADEFSPMVAGGQHAHIR